MAKMFKALICAFSFCLLLACGKEDDQREVVPEPFISNIESYTSVNTFINAYADSVREDSVYQTGMLFWRKTINLTTVTLNKFQHLGYEGKLIGTFVNARLATLVFYPETFDQYFLQLHSTEPNLQRDSELKKDHLVIRVYKDYRGRDYVSWADERLNAEIDRTWK